MKLLSAAEVPGRTLAQGVTHLGNVTIYASFYLEADDDGRRLAGVTIYKGLVSFADVNTIEAQRGIIFTSDLISVRNSPSSLRQLMLDAEQLIKQIR